MVHVLKRGKYGIYVARLLRQDAQVKQIRGNFQENRKWTPSERQVNLQATSRKTLHETSG
jgi:hypothetical protein